MSLPLPWHRQAASRVRKPWSPARMWCGLAVVGFPDFENSLEMTLIDRNQKILTIPP